MLLELHGQGDKPDLRPRIVECGIKDDEAAFQGIAPRSVRVYIQSWMAWPRKWISLRASVEPGRQRLAHLPGREPELPKLLMVVAGEPDIDRIRWRSRCRPRCRSRKRTVRRRKGVRAVAADESTRIPRRAELGYCGLGSRADGRERDRCYQHERVHHWAQSRYVYRIH